MIRYALLVKWSDGHAEHYDIPPWTQQSPPVLHIGHGQASSPVDMFNERHGLLGMLVVHGADRPEWLVAKYREPRDGEPLGPVTPLCGSPKHPMSFLAGEHRDQLPTKGTPSEYLACPLCRGRRGGPRDDDDVMGFKPCDVCGGNGWIQAHVPNPGQALTDEPSTFDPPIEDALAAGVLALGGWVADRDDDDTKPDIDGPTAAGIDLRHILLTDISTVSENDARRIHALADLVTALECLAQVVTIGMIRPEAWLSPGKMALLVDRARNHLQTILVNAEYLSETKADAIDLAAAYSELAPGGKA